MTEAKKKTAAPKAPKPPTTLAEALVKAQSEFPEIPKDGTGVVRGESKAGKPYEYEYTYATLPTIFRLTLPVLNENGLVLTQTSGDGCLITTLHHISGETLESRLEMPSPTTLSPQKYGAAHSYYRRYEANGMLGLAPDDDIDADGVEAPRGEKKEKNSAPPSAGGCPPGTIAEITKRVVYGHKDLVKAWYTEEIESEGHALRIVADMVEATISQEGWDPDKNFYKLVVQKMNGVVDERAAKD